MFAYHRGVSQVPIVPTGKFVWVRNHNDQGSPRPGVVICWQHAPVHNATAAEWVALVAQSPFGSALLIDWVGAERLLPIRDDTPADAGTA